MVPAKQSKHQQQQQQQQQQPRIYWSSKEIKESAPSGTIRITRLDNTNARIGSMANNTTCLVVVVVVGIVVVIIIFVAFVVCLLIFVFKGK